MSRLAVVTGGNKGIGFAICRALAKIEGINVLLTARDCDRGNEAVRLLEGEGLRTSFHQLDILDKASCSALAKYIEGLGGLDILINNAGIAYKGNAWGEEVARTTAATNYTGTANVCEALLPLLRPAARVVVVSSSAGLLGKYSKELQDRFLDPNITKPQIDALLEEFFVAVRNNDYAAKGWPSTTYGVSKAAVSALTRVYARDMFNKYEGDQRILINAVCPGWVRTDMAGDKAPKNIDEGAETPVYAALLPFSESNNGQFFSDKKVRSWV